jgi:uncharacterized membrane protein YqaE (UPF0057 family)
MKKIKLGLYTLVAGLVLTSCATSNDVVSNKKIQKRKYNKGFFVDKNKTSFAKADKVSKAVISVEDQVFESDNVSENEIILLNSEMESNEVVQVEKVENIAVLQKEETSEFSNKSTIDSTEESVDIKNVEGKTSETKKKFRSKRQNVNNQSSSDDMMILLVILCFLLPFVAVGIKTSWDIKKVLICLILSILFWLPGVIYALLVVLDVI